MIVYLINQKNRSTKYRSKVIEFKINNQNIQQVSFLTVQEVRRLDSSF